MKYLLKVLLVLLVILFVLKLVIHIFDKGHKLDYSIGNFNVNETLTVDKIDNYYFEIKRDDFSINFQIFKNYNKKEKIINKLEYKDTGQYKCILPIFKNNQILTDIMCLKENKIMYAHDINDKNVNNFVKELENKGYKKDNFLDKTEPIKISNTLAVYQGNIVSNHYLALESYQGATLVNNTVKQVKLFTNDIYKKEVSTFTDKYYIVANYNNEYTFKNFYIVNLINGNIREIRSYDEISFDSIIEGAVGDDIYIFDKDAETQYKLSLKYETIEKQDQIKYYNGSWSTMTLNEALSDKKFDNYYSADINGYDKVNKIGKSQGYYYLYKKENDKYLVYRADIQNPNLITYIFTTTDKDSVIYLNDYIYFKNGNSVYYYFAKGVRKVLENSELEFNQDILFGSYIK